MTFYPIKAVPLLALALAGMPAAATAQIVGADAAACTNSQATAVLVHVSGFKNSQGTVRVQAYGPRPSDFLEKGKWVRRVEVPLAGRTSLDVCLRLPQPGNYGIAVRHDANGSGKSDWNDGGGFSRNPQLSLLHMKPSFDKVAVPVSRGTSRVSVVMQYRHGLSIGPEHDAAAG